MHIIMALGFPIVSNKKNNIRKGPHLYAISRFFQKKNIPGIINPTMSSVITLSNTYPSKRPFPVSSKNTHLRPTCRFVTAWIIPIGIIYTRATHNKTIAVSPTMNLHKTPKTKGSNYTPKRSAMISAQIVIPEGHTSMQTQAKTNVITAFFYLKKS